MCGNGHGILLLIQWTDIMCTYCLIYLRLFLLHLMMIFVLFLLPTELFSPWHEASTTCNDHFKQFCVLAGIWRYLCLWVSGRQRLSELLLLLWRMQIWILEKGAYSHRHLGAGLIFSGLFPYVISALQLGLLGWIPISLNVAVVMSKEHYISLFTFAFPRPVVTNWSRKEKHCSVYLKLYITFEQHRSTWQPFLLCISHSHTCAHTH